VSCGPSAFRSKVINNTLNPEWNEVFLLYVRDISKDLLKAG
jgi:Ca2+-dependent lipid-binding protein